MERAIDTQLEDLKKMILLMGGHVEKSLSQVTTALLTKDLAMFDEVHAIEKRINEDHIRVDNVCMNILAKQGPVAKDLRLILSVIKINNDLERMGDQTVNISYSGKDYLGRKPIQAQLSDIQKMSEIAGRMVKGSLDCFVRGDVDEAKQILLMDDEIDALKSKVFKDATAHMKIHSDDVEAALDLILIARNLERLGDHATNIAEDVIFAYTGKDVRHGGKFG
ncbi:phosphate signaling complex protein PhoU [Bdellovibrio svalbardensis]|uniref:Phosphate-specific transport system accessory protein PhoU n=1 Tax=Bdellovibrio svalbardensis TaxID=2972972 RepID=A0ABT6DS47_9BACT|nr:phosphate signaling complex protein PhoU [Bdellovibrio svalbardensis]MDG0817983.1 phosphate signaling complex protein PhoU [Bdellovibrio svalbardensis]